MNGSVLDTNVIIRYMSGDILAERLVKTAGEIFVPSIALGELYYGVYKSARMQENLDILEKSKTGFSIISIDDSIAKEYGFIKERLRKKGINIPENDIWIAATSISRHSTLITFDSHFFHIEGLMVASIPN